MNPVQESILERLGAWPAAFAVLRNHAERYARRCSSIALDDTLQLGHAPWDGPEAYAVRLFAPARKAWVAAFKGRVGRPIPPGYRDFLLVANGCSVHGLVLFGLPPSMQGATPRLDRSRAQPLDLGTANVSWAREYATDPAQFHFGGREWTDEENTGYFWSKGGLRAILPSGEVVGEWGDLPALLADELPAAERRLAARVPAEWWH